MITRSMFCAAFAASLFAFAGTDTQSGQWLIDFQTDGQIQLTLRRENHENSHPVPSSSFQGLSRKATHFQFVRDAGTFVCDGRFESNHGAGTFVFEPNQEFVAEMQTMGYNIAPDRIIDMAVFDVSRTFVHELEKFGHRGLSLDDLVRFRIHGVSIAYIRTFQDAGYQLLSADELVRMRIHGVTPDMLKKVRAAGFAHPTTEQLVEMRIHGVLD